MLKNVDQHCSMSKNDIHEHHFVEKGVQFNDSCATREFLGKDL